MKKLLALLSLILLSCWTMGQSIGLRTVTEVSGQREINNSLGFGGYISFNDFSDRVEILLFADYTKKKGEFSDCQDCTTSDIFSDYQRKKIGLSGLYRIPLNNKLNFKFGPNINYSWINATRQGQVANWIETFEANFIGFGVVTNLNLHQIFNLPIDLDLFVTPNYLLITKDFNDKKSYPEYENTLKLLNIQIGISYSLIGKKK